VPPRDANPYDLIFNALGATIGAGFGAALARSARAKRAIIAARARWFVSGQLGDVGLALLALWLVAQANPGVALFAVAFHPNPTALSPQLDSAELLLEAAGSGFLFVGVMLFGTLLVRAHRHARLAALLLVLGALLLKSAAAALMLRPTAWQTWVEPGVLIGIAVGALLLPLFMALPRPVQVATCGIALLASLGTPMLVPELVSTTAPVRLFDWRYGQLLNYNGLTHAVLLLWPVLAAAWLFGLAGRPAWGRANEAV
jgi:hypothetical protein